MNKVLAVTASACPTISLADVRSRRFHIIDRAQVHERDLDSLGDAILRRVWTPDPVRLRFVDITEETA